jgi:two-component sensor histidine kinase
MLTDSSISAHLTRKSLPLAHKLSVRVVMVDDSPADRRLCRILLEEEYGSKLDFLEAQDARRGLALCDPPPDCLLLDYKLPDMTGVEFLRLLATRHSTDSKEFAVVMLTGLGNEQVAVESMRAGAQDYLVKDKITSESLRLAIGNATGRIGLLGALEAERDRLAQSLEEKDALLEEVHHRVKNNLQLIASLLRLQAQAFGDPRLSEALRKSQDRVESMALIHEQLYQARNLREVDLAAHARLLVNHLMHAHGLDPARVRCRVRVEELRLGVGRAIPAALILNELISNALKHAFAAGQCGNLEVTGGRCEGDVVIEVRDDGPGLAPGVELDPPHTLGLHIVAILMRQLRGAFVIENCRDENCLGSGEGGGARNETDAESGAGKRGPGVVCRLRFPAEGENDARRKLVQSAAG